jgi:hypothetical protein
MIFAPSPRKTLAFSADIFYGMHIMHPKPFTAEANASPIPVFPDVASTILLPYFRTPLLIASRTILFPILS